MTLTGQLKEQFAGQALVFAVDVAKTQQFALLSNTEQSESVLMQWNHLEQTAELINELKQLNTPHHGGHGIDEYLWRRHALSVQTIRLYDPPSQRQAGA
jgi:hypothetical protein